MVKNPPAMQETCVWSLGWEDPLEEGMATHSSQYSCLENPYGQGSLVGYSPWNSSGVNIGVDSLSLLQGIFPTQGSNTGLPHSRWILYQLSHRGRPSILEWVAYPLSSGSSWPRTQTGVSYIAGGFFYQLSYRGSPLYVCVCIILTYVLNLDIIWY